MEISRPETRVQEVEVLINIHRSFPGHNKGERVQLSPLVTAPV